MAYITKRGSSYGVRYTYQDEQGKPCNNGKVFLQKRRQQIAKNKSNMNLQTERF